MLRGRLVDNDLLAEVRKQPCQACGKRAPSDPHHVKTRGAFGADIYENLMPLCRDHHTEIHQIGLGPFAKKYFTVRSWLIKRSWTQDHRGKWIYPSHKEEEARERFLNDL